MKISILGNGKMASMLVRKLQHESVRLELWARDFEKAKTIFADLALDIKKDIKQIGFESDLIIVAVADSAIEEVGLMLEDRKGLVIHTSGATSIDVLRNFENRGVWWPPASVQMMADDLSDFTACVESNNSSNSDVIVLFSKLVGITKIMECDSELRLKMHTAAVFANNFITYILLNLNQYCAQNNIPLDIYKPMLNQAVESFLYYNTQNLTGPASRGDKQTIAKHIGVLENETDLKKIYLFLTENILKYKNYDINISNM